MLELVGFLTKPLVPNLLGMSVDLSGTVQVRLLFAKIS